MRWRRRTSGAALLHSASAAAKPPRLRSSASFTDCRSMTLASPAAFCGENVLAGDSPVANRIASRSRPDLAFRHRTTYPRTLSTQDIWNSMISDWLSASLARRNIHYGWVMVGVTFFTALITAGTVGAPGVFIVPLQHEFGWSTAEISSALSIRFILFGLMAPFAAALLNRYGLRNMTLLAQLIVVSALVASLVMTKVWQLMLLWGVVIGIGTGMTALVLGATVAARWFVARRGLVVGILTASVATGQLVFLPLLAHLTDHYG